MTREDLRKHKYFNIVSWGNATYIDEDYVKIIEDKIIETQNKMDYDLK